MQTLLLLVGWCILFVLCWPLALLALIAWPIVWLLSIPQGPPVSSGSPARVPRMIFR